MSQTLPETGVDWREMTRDLVTEDDEPVDNFFSAKQQRLLVEPLYSSWQPPQVAADEPRVFMADSNVGVFFSRHQPPIVPDMFLSLDVVPNAEWFADEHRSYFVWEFDKVPEVAVEIVSNRKGGEVGKKMKRYAQIDVGYYVVFDPFRVLGDEPLQVYERALWRNYRKREDFHLPEVELSLKLWQGEFEGVAGEWLRWCDAEGNLIPTGMERAATESVARRTVETRLAVEREARTAAEAELEGMRAELLRLREQAEG